MSKGTSKYEFVNKEERLCILIYVLCDEVQVKFHVLFSPAPIILLWIPNCFCITPSECYFCHKSNTYLCRALCNIVIYYIYIYVFHPKDGIGRPLSWVNMWRYGKNGILQEGMPYTSSPSGCYWVIFFLINWWSSK